jgi:ATP-binding cassette subfamily B protein
MTVATVTPPPVPRAQPASTPFGPKLKTEPPASVLSALARSGLDAREVVISFASDIDLHGRSQRQWVVASTTSVRVLDEDSSAPLLSLEFTETADFRTVAVYGSGLLQAKVGGIWLDLVRYSNAAKYHFGRVAKRLGQLRQGQSVEFQPEDEVDPRRCEVSGILLDYPGQVSPFTVKHGAAISRVMHLMRPYWPAACAMMTLLVIAVALDMIAPRLIQYLIDHLLDPKSAGKAQPFAWLEHFGSPTRLLLLVVAAYAAAQVLRSIATVANGRIASRVGTSITFDIRTKLVAHLENLSLSYHDKQSVGSLVGRVAYDTEAVQGFMAQLTGGFLMQILMVVLAALSMWSLEPRLALWALVPAPFVIAGTFVFWRFVYPHYQRFWERSSRQAGMLNGLLSGIRVVKSFAQEDRELKRFVTSSETLRDARRRVDASAATFYPLMGLIFGVGGWIVWYVGGQKVLENNAALASGAHADAAAGISLGTLIAFFSYLGLFYGPLSGLTNLTTWLTQFSTQMHRIFEVLDTPIATPDSRQPVTLPKVEGAIEFRGVTFGYSRQSPILKNVSFSIEPGQMIGVVGRSGSGKTTVINLISRFYDVDEGEVLIDGADVRRLSKQDLRGNIGVVLQEPFLFRGTLWDNLVYGRTQATIEEVIASSRAGNAHDFIMRQTQAYDTWVGERGSGLSGGERQRLSIARALLCEPRILILDEATSSVDSESELAIQNALGELVKGRTSIVIAHRLSTLRNCHKIMVVDDGRIAEQGSHAELMKLDGRYAKLVRIQGAQTAEEGVDTLAERERRARDEAPAAVVDSVTGLGPIGGHRPRWLDPKFTRIALDARGSLTVTVVGERAYGGVFALRCLPARHRDKYLSLRWIIEDNREQEIGLIRDLEEWPAEAQRLVREALSRRYLIHTVTAIDEITEEHNYLKVKAQTDLGERSFIMKWAYETAQDYGTKGKVLLDVEENRYVIHDVAALPEPGRADFERFIYW